MNILLLKNHHRRLFLATFLLFSLSSSFSQDVVEWCATTEADVIQGFTNGTCFRYFTSETLPREDAKTRCANEVPGVAGDLARIPSQFAQATLSKNLLSLEPSPSNYWIGARGYSSPQWRWADGSPLGTDDYTNWAVGNPPIDPSADNKFCAYVLISDTSLQWRIDNCGAQKQFICEYRQFQDRPDGAQHVPLSYTLDWYSARVECRREGGELFGMTSADQLADWRSIALGMITSAGGIAQLPGKGEVWLGLNSQLWLWESIGKEVEWSNFNSVSLATEPVQECVYLSADLKWIPTSCSLSLNYLCQFEGSTLSATTPTASSSPQSSGTSPSFSSLAPPIGTRASNDLSWEWIVVIIVICVICFLIMVFAILLACFGHLWVPRIRRRLGYGESYTVTPNAAERSKTPQIDVAVTAHPSYNSQGTGTTGDSSRKGRRTPKIDVIVTDADPSVVVQHATHTRASAVYALDEPLSDVPEIYTSPTFLYSLPSHRPLEGVVPVGIDPDSSESSNIQSQSSTASSPVSSPALTRSKPSPLPPLARPQYPQKSKTAPFPPPPSTFRPSPASSHSSSAKIYGAPVNV